VILASLLNSYPRIGDRPAEQVLRRAIARADRGEAPASAVRDAEDELTRLAIAEQVAAGLDLLTDGQVRWHDPVSHIARGLAGFRVGGLLRYFDTNTYYRQPEATGPIGRERPILVDGYRFAAAAAAPRPVKAILTGPLTIARLSRDATSPPRGLRALVLEIASALNREVLDLEAAGAPVIQIDEPVLARHAGDLPLLREALPKLFEGLGRARVILATSFGDAQPLLRDLAELPVALIGFDLLATGADLASLSRGLPKDLGLLLGVVEGRNTRLEDPAVLFERHLRPLLSHSEAMRGVGGPGGREIHLAPNHGLEFLPREVARAKMSILSALRDRVRASIS
jgi:5-methyltetrahydropteroyltriglutamate--homocysteine methyltransferase